MNINRRIKLGGISGVSLLLSLSCIIPAYASENSVLWLDSYDSVEEFSCGFARVEKDGEAYFIDPKGERLEIHTEYVDRYLGSFHSGLAAFVQKREAAEGEPAAGTGWIGLDGTVVFPPEYDYHILGGSDFRRNIVFTRDLEGNSVVLGCCGRVLATAPEQIELYKFPDTQNGLAPALITDETGEQKLGFVDQEFNVVLPGRYCDTLYGFLEGGAYVDLIPWSKSCIINTRGELIWGPVDFDNPYWFDIADGFWNGLISVPDESGKWGAIDTYGNLVVPYEYDYYFEFHEGYAFAYKDGVLQVIDTSGNLTLPYVESWNFELDNNQYRFSEGLASICSDGKWGYIDVSGQTIIPCIYNEARPFSEGLAWVRRDDNVWGILKSPFAEYSDWADDGIGEAYIHEIVTDRTSSHFQSSLTRIQCAELMVNLAELVTGRPIFEAETDRFTDTADWIPRKGVTAGVVEGLGDGTYFGPDETVSREQMAAMLYRAIQYIQEQTGRSVLAEAGGLDGFTDAGQVSGWAADSLAALTASGILQGTSSATLSPKDTTTVEQAILLTLRAYQEFSK